MNKSGTTLKKGIRSRSNGNCVEVAETPTIVGVRDSKDTFGPLLVFATPQWRAFITGVKSGQFDRR